MSLTFTPAFLAVMILEQTDGSTDPDERYPLGIAIFPYPPDTRQLAVVDDNA